MGGTRGESDCKRTPRGVRIRTHMNVESLQIDFTFRGVRCRESLRLEPTTANIRYADGLRREIIRKIEQDSFRYNEYFPESPRARLFGHVVTRATVGERATAYLTGCDQAAKNGKLSPSTVNGYRKIVNGQILPRFSNVPLRELGPAMLREWVAGLGTTAKTARNVVSVLRSILDDAKNDELIESNPLDRIALNKLLATTAKKSEYVVDPFDAAEKQAILGAADGQARNLYQFALWTGLRTSELIALEWGDVDWVHGCVKVQRAVVVKQEKGTKTAAGTRDVLLLPAARAALEAQKLHTFLAGHRVFHNPKTGAPWETDAQIRKTSWLYVLKKAGVRYRNPYQTRHTYASTLLSKGENPWWVANQMGHVDVEMIFRHYGKWIPNNRHGSGYQLVNDWAREDAPADANGTQTARENKKNPRTHTG